MEALPVVETFYSLQGEGAHAGWPACFIRLAGCRNACSFCDTRDSWNAGAFPTVSVAGLAEDAAASGAPSCVVTGGEPTLHKLDGLCCALHAAGLQTWLETSGSEPLSGNWDWICLSPKKGVFVYPEYYRKANEIKVVIQTSDDFAFAEEQASLANENCLCYLQAEWSVSKRMSEAIVAYIRKHPRWKLSLQTHKFLGIL